MSEKKVKSPLRIWSKGATLAHRCQSREIGTDHDDILTDLHPPIIDALILTMPVFEGRTRDKCRVFAKGNRFESRRACIQI